MSKKKHHRKNGKSSKWLPPEGSVAYFFPFSDLGFREAHPVGYVFLVLLGIIVLIAPVILYIFYTVWLGVNSAWMMVGWAGAFLIGVGLFNFVAIIIKQYLGHWVSILSFLLGAGLIALSLCAMQ